MTPQPVTPHPDELDKLIDTCLHPERNGLLIKERVAEGASHEWLVKRELKAAITKLRLQDKIDLLQRLMDDFEWETTRFIQLELIMLEFKTLKASEEKK